MDEPATTVGTFAPTSDYTSPSISTSRHHRSSSTRSAISYPVSRGRQLDQLDYHSTPRITTSPDRVSTTSSILTAATTPHLRKKPNLHALKLGQHSRAASVIETSSHSTPSAKKTASPLRPAFGSENGQLASQPTHKDHLRVTLSRTNSVPSPPKRPPASHSSYGVATTSGPPPSYSTQRTLSQERIRPVERTRTRRMSISNDRSQETGTYTQPETVQNPSDNLIQPPALHIQSSPDTADTQSIPTPTDGEEIMGPDVRQDHGLGVSNGEEESKESSDSPKSEDLFLNIAKVDSSQPSSSRSERRRTRISLPFLSNSRSATAQKSSPYPANYDSPSVRSRDDTSQQYRKRSSIGQHMPSAFSRVSQSRQEAEEDSPEGDPILPSDAVSSAGRRPSTYNADTLRPNLRTGTGLRNRLVSESGHLDRPKLAEHMTSESTISTTAPSTVWDELDDLKSRIRKLELTGKLPSSSAAAMSSIERPRTATTAATTMSGSPKHNKAAPVLTSAVEGVPSTLHPLLHESLSNAKAVVANDVYQKLQATATDALQLASMMAYDNPSSRAGITLATERQIRRRTESMCRSLTELAIALAAEQKPTQPHPIPNNKRESASMQNVTLRSRRYSNEPSDRPPVSARVQSRLESRRTSLQYGLPNTFGPNSPDLPNEPSPTVQTQFSSRPPRTSTAFRSRRSGVNHDGNGDEDDGSANIRPVSRAMTETAAFRRHNREYGPGPHEYTSHHPLPNSNTFTEASTAQRTPMSAGLTTNFASRRKYGSPTSAGPLMTESSPLGPREPWGRITIVSPDTSNHKSHTAPSPGYFGNTDSVSHQYTEAAGTPASARSISTRKSFGFASRIGSSVGSRLRAAKGGNINREGTEATSYEGENIEQQ